MARKSPKSVPDVARLLVEHQEHAAIERAAPTRKELAAALGPFKTCTEPTHRFNPDGTDTVKITSDRAAPEENKRRFAAYTELTERKRELEIARSQNRNAREGEVVFHDVRTGDVRATTPDREDHIARKKWARPGRSRRVFVGFGRAR
jgi:hypothetical protein